MKNFNPLTAISDITKKCLKSTINLVLACSVSAIGVSSVASVANAVETSNNTVNTKVTKLADQKQVHTSSNYNRSYRSLINIAKLQSAMNDINGSFVVTDVRGNVLASVGKDTMLPPASVSKLFTTVAAIDAYENNDPRFMLNYNNIGALKEANSSSNNVYFEKLADQIGIDYLQSTIRRITNNQSIVIGNGSGCTDYTRGDSAHSCSGKSKTHRPTRISVGDTVKVLKYLHQRLSANGKQLWEVMGNNLDGQSTVASNYSDLDYIVTAKTGTLRGINSLAGVMYGPNNETIYFAAVIKGTKANSIAKQIKVLNSTFSY